MGELIRALRARLTYANVVATVAVILAAGGGAYAAIGTIPDSSGVFHGCVNRSTGALRVVTSASTCARPKVVRRRGHRVRLPGELAVAWNARGVQGLPGPPGQKGDPGPTSLPAGYLTSDHILQGALDASAGAGQRIFFDPATGADVRDHQHGIVEIDNDNTTDHLSINGFSILTSTQMDASVDESPTGLQTFPQGTVAPTFLDLMITRVGSSAATSVSLHLTCDVADNGATTFVEVACVGVR